MLKIIIFLIITIYIFPIFPARADSYCGWNETLSGSSNNLIQMEDPCIVILENNYTNHLYTLLQKNKEIETDLTIIELKLSELQIPTYYLEKNSFNNLDQYMELVKKFYSSPIVTGTFYDWRDVSKYRRAAGLHYGYDIAMPANTGVIAGWSGEVTAITQWYGQEHGVTVKSPNGISVTYGHIIPYVSIGQKILPGSLLGFVAIDHLDVKMKDLQGCYIDFGSMVSSQLTVNKKDNSNKINSIKGDRYLLKARASLNKEKAHAEYIIKSSEYYNLRIADLTKTNYNLARDYYKKKDLFEKGCIAKKNCDEGKNKFIKSSMNRYASYKQRLIFKVINIPFSLKIIKNENTKVKENLLKAKYSKGSKKEWLLKLIKLNRENDYIGLVLSKFKFQKSLSKKDKSLSVFPPINLGTSNNRISIIESQLKEAENILNEARNKYENSENLYSLGYISKKNLNEMGENYQKALANYRLIQQKLTKTK